MSRYSRHIVLSEIGQKGQDKLSTAKVLVVGAGGLGCPALQYLVAAGIGTVGIIDFDVVEESNLQRQILFGTSSLGINKAIAAKSRLEDLNPTINIIAYPHKLISKNAHVLFENYDIIVDGTDDFETRYLINDVSIITNKPVVYGAIYKFEGQVSVFNYKGGPSYRCLFPKPPKEGSVARCSEIGVLGVLPGIIGCMQANEVFKIVLDFEDVLTGKLLNYNAKTAQSSIISFSKLAVELEKTLSPKEDFKEKDEKSSETQVRIISASEAFQLDNPQFIDVREYGEYPQLNLTNYVHIPLDKIEHQIKQIHSEKVNILFCQTGTRSIAAVQILQGLGYTNCYTLEGGVFAIIAQLKIKM